jgi:MSHA biogenesis protein MshK
MISMKRTIIRYFFIFGVFLNDYSHAIHDPTKPVIREASISNSTNETVYNLQSIIIAPGRILAMINGKKVGTGSYIDGARVLAIGKNHVVLLYAGQKKAIYLFGKRLWNTH